MSEVSKAKPTAEEWSVLILTVRLVVRHVSLVRLEEREGGGGLIKADSFSVIIIQGIQLTFRGPGWCPSVSGQLLGVLARLSVTGSLAPAHHGLHEARGPGAPSWFCPVLVLPAGEQHVGSVGWACIHVEQSTGLTSILLISSHSSLALGHKPWAPTSSSASPLASGSSCLPRLWKLFGEHERHDGGGESC